MLNNLKNAASSVKNSVAMTAKNIAAEALETAQELRQIHEVSAKILPPTALLIYQLFPLPSFHSRAGGLVSESTRGTEATGIS